jgi:hypothetical protein
VHAAQRLFMAVQRIGRLDEACPAGIAAHCSALQGSNAGEQCSRGAHGRKRNAHCVLYLCALPVWLTCVAHSCMCG